MKYLKFFLITGVIILIVSCLKDKEQEVFADLLGTFYNNDGIYVVADTASGANGFAAKFFFNNEEVFKDIKNETRLFIYYKMIKERKGVGYDAECLAHRIIPTRKIYYGTEDDFPKDHSSAISPVINKLYISHDFLNIASKINYNINDDKKHFLYVVNEEDVYARADTVTLRFYYIDREQDDWGYYKDSLFYISVPIKELHDKFPKSETINIKVLSRSNNSTTIPYIKPPKDN